MSKLATRAFMSSYGSSYARGAYPTGLYGGDGLRSFGGLGSIGGFSAPFSYSPNLAPVGSGSAYFPGDVSADAAALNYLGYLADADYAQISPSTGTQSGDMNNSAGAWDPSFRGAIANFQNASGITADTWVGPQTRTALLGAVTLKNANPGVTPNIPSTPVPVTPGSVPALPTPVPGTVPASATSSEDTTTYLLAGAAIIAVAGLAYYALS